MGDIIKKLEELIEDGRFIETKRPSYPVLPLYEDYEPGSLNGCGTTEVDPAGGNDEREGIEGKP